MWSSDGETSLQSASHSFIKLSVIFFARFTPSSINQDLIDVPEARLRFPRFARRHRHRDHHTDLSRSRVATRMDTSRIRYIGWYIRRTAALRSDYMSRYVLVTRTYTFASLSWHDHEKRETGYRQLLSLIATSTNDVTCQSVSHRLAQAQIYIYIYPYVLYVCMYVYICHILIGKDAFENLPVDKIVFDWPIKMKRSKISSSQLAN